MPALHYFPRVQRHGPFDSRVFLLEATLLAADLDVIVAGLTSIYRICRPLHGYGAE